MGEAKKRGSYVERVRNAMQKFDVIELEPGLWLDKQRSEAVFDGEWLRQELHTRLGREPTARELEYMTQHLRLKVSRSPHSF